MTDDCVNETCTTPIECCQHDTCMARPERSRVQQLIDDMHERLRRTN